ncbi:hypothetical protein HG536_0D03610 [Torulaspora globosa]|uniref:DNA polymerase alpha subunit B n=1 Tax=Torulaspora globosa TaxID=48254 RepID=A0A7G3ZH53_9SACH|nr:uncharacterized protein HG536_0D03610 [Torulaspora globosa]QLL32839.1 hypothetical protein HG536_0D03610 [Torulaspora globosa]
MSKSEIVAQFGPEAEASEIISSLQDLSKIYALTIEDLYIKWEQFSYQKHENRTELNSRNLDSFKKFLQLQVEKKAAQASPAISNPTLSAKIVKPMKPLHSSPSLFGYNIPKGSALKKRKLNTEALVQEKGHKLEFSDGLSEHHTNVNDGQGEAGHNAMTNTPPKSSGTSQATATRDHEPGKILTCLNPENIETAVGLDENSREKVRITPFYDPERYKFRTMRQSLSDAADVLDLQIETIAKIIQNHYELSPSDFGDPSIQAQSQIHAVGRIVPDSTTTEEFLNMDSLALETSRMAGVGRRIRLDLTDIDEVSLFCGQIVAVRGKNADGDSFKVNEVLALPYPNSPVSTQDELQKCCEALEGKPLKTLVTSGPYFSCDSFDLHFLEQFAERVNTEIKPHVLIMFGPFIDVTNPMIAKGAIPHFPQLKNQPNTLDEVFTKVMVPVLKRIRQDIQVILIPSTRDALSKHASYPQDSYNRKYLQLPKNFKCFVNPATFQLNEVFFGCSNVDTYKDMKEMTKGGNTSMRNRFDRVSEHILQQRRFYPVFPGGIKKKLLSTKNDGKKVYEHISGADLEVPYLGLTEFVGNFTPDIIIIPSEMHHFARVGQNVIMINPGRFIGHNGKPGTCAEISITSPDLEKGNLTKVDGPEPTFLHNVWKRARVDIVTI